MSVKVSAPPATAAADDAATGGGASCVNVGQEESDLLQNLLGVSDAQALDKMLDSATSAAELLGVEPTHNDIKSLTSDP